MSKTRKLKSKKVQVPPSARVSFLALEKYFSRILFIPQEIVKVKAQCIWSANSKKKSKYEFEKKFSYCIKQSSPYWSHKHAKIKFKKISADADCYVCLGSNSLGSGRSIFKDGYQVKGVGRTSLAKNFGASETSNGELSSLAAFEEIVYSAWLAQLFSNQPIQPVALLHFQIKNKSKLLLIRPGSPIRLGHLQMLKAQSEKFLNPRFRRGSWKFFLMDLMGNNNEDLTQAQILQYFKFLLQRALTQVAESRIFGVNTSNWSDNWDLFSRTFDLEESTFCFGVMIKKEMSTDFSLPSLNQSLPSFLANLSIHFNTPRPFRTLEPLVSCARALAILSEELGVTQKNFDSVLNWKFVNTQYERICKETLARVFEFADKKKRLHIRKKVGRQLDLVPSIKTKEFRTDLWLEKYAPSSKFLKLIKKNTMEEEIRKIARKVDRLPSNKVKKHLPIFLNQALQLINNSGA